MIIMLIRIALIPDHKQSLYFFFTHNRFLNLFKTILCTPPPANLSFRFFKILRWVHSWHWNPWFHCLTTSRIRCRLREREIWIRLINSVLHKLVVRKEYRLCILKKKKKKKKKENKTNIIGICLPLSLFVLLSFPHICVYATRGNTGKIY